jgi:Protease inhibitor Inh
MRPGFIAAGLILMGLSGCGSMSGSMPYSAPGPTPLAPQPVSPVISGPLAAPATTPVTDPNAPVDVAVAGTDAMADPSVGAGDVRKGDLSGGWKLASGGESCQLNMSLTSFGGGYRASTRGCESAELQNIGSWALNGKEVVLRDASGAAVASLYSTAPGRFSGLTALTKRGLTFYR